MHLNGSVKLFRRPVVADPLTRGRPGATVPGSWDAAVTSMVAGAWVDETAVTPRDGDDRVGAVVSATLYVEASGGRPDVRKGDGISSDPDAVRPSYVIGLVPFVPSNPFTDWAPLLEVPLERVTG